MLGVCVAASVTDVRTHRIPNKLTVSAAAGALVFWLVFGLVEGRGLTGGGQGAYGTLLGSFLGLLCGLIPFGILVTIGGLGGGDMKLMAAIGAWSASWQVVLGTTIYALIAGALFGVFLMIKHKRVMLTLTRLFGIAVTRGRAMKPDDDQTTPKVPFALAALVGAAIAGAEHMLGWWEPVLW
jgi:Flp pilus assembly protein protease CpaA